MDLARKFAACRRPNWDGDGARWLDANTIAYAQHVLDGLKGQRPNHISSTRDGGVQFEWVWPGGKLEIELLANTARVCLSVDDSLETEILV